MLHPVRKQDWESENLYKKMEKRFLTVKNTSNSSENAEAFPKYFQHTLMKKSLPVCSVDGDDKILIVAQKDI